MVSPAFKTDIDGSLSKIFACLIMLCDLPMLGLSWFEFLNLFISFFKLRLTLL